MELQDYISSVGVEVGSELPKNIFKIGIGTWKIDPENFNNEIEGLKYSFDKGQNYLSLSMLYNNGEVVRKIKSFIDLVGRKNLFISAYLDGIDFSISSGLFGFNPMHDVI